MSENRHRGWKYKRWQQAVFQKDNYQCCFCGSIDNLTADHIKPAGTHPHLIYDINNGRTLCNNYRVKDMLDSWQKHLFKKV